jgi:hypothetical protein
MQSTRIGQNLPYTPAADPLGHTAPLDFRAAFPVLGKPLEVRSNSPAVVAAAERAFGRWRDLDARLIEPAKPCVVDVVVHPSPLSVVSSQLLHGTNDVDPPTDHGPRTTDHGLQTRSTPFTVRVHGGCLLAGDGANLMTAQLDAGRALAFVTPELAAREPWLRYHVLELLGLAMVAWHDRTPLHAGAVVCGGRAVLLTGRSMAGKSTLCYACLRDGFQLLAEDVVYISRRRGLRLWGIPWRIHLLPDTARLFSELADVAAVPQPNGKVKLAVETSAFGADRARCHAERAVVCVVERREGAASALEPIDPRAAVAALSYDRESGFDLYSDTRAAAEALVAGGAYRLTVGGDLASAVALVRELAGG